jgi:hypothetical protein
MRVKLSEIIEGIEFQSDERSSYLNRLTGDVVMITDEEIRAAEEGNSLDDYPEWQLDSIEQAKDILADETDDKYISLPSRVDVHEYNIMERFCLTVADKDVSDSLYLAIKGKGAFSRFKDAVHRYEIAEDWYKFRDDYIKQIAKDWCKENDIEYTED